MLCIGLAEPVRNRQPVSLQRMLHQLSSGSSPWTAWAIFTSWHLVVLIISMAEKPQEALYRRAPDSAAYLYSLATHSRIFSQCTLAVLLRFPWDQKAQWPKRAKSNMTPTIPPSGVPTLYNLLPLGVGGTCEYDRLPLPQLGYITQGLMVTG